MKSQILWAAVACLILSRCANAATQGQKTLPKGVSCSATANPFVSYLATKNIEIYSSPKFESSKCGFEWSTFGTCCNVTDLKNWATKEITGFVASHRSLVKQIEQLIAYMEDPLEKFKNNLTTEEQKAHYISYNRTVKSFPSCKDTFLTTQEVCNKELLGLKLGAACDSCSGRSKAFFSEGRALVSMSVCREVFGKCEDTWQALFVLVKIAWKLINIGRLMDIKDERFLALANGSSPLRTITGWLNYYGLRGKMQTCLYTSCDEGVMADVCNALIPLTGRHSSRFLQIKSPDSSNFDQCSEKEEAPDNYKQDIVVVPDLPRNSLTQSSSNTFNFSLTFP